MAKSAFSKGRVYERNLEECFQEYYDEKRALNKSQATLYGYEEAINLWFNYLRHGNYSLAAKDVDVGYVLSYSHHNLNEGMKPTTLNHYLRVVRAFLYWCMEKQYVSPFKIRMVAEQEVIKRTYSDEDCMKLLAKPRKNDSFVEWRTWAIINWVLATGNRASTICNIKIGDVSFSKKELYINRTKNNKASILPLSPALANALNEYIKTWLYNFGANDWLFPSSTTAEQLTVNALKHSIRRYNLAREVEITSIHAFRHTFAKNWIRNTGDVFRLQKILGHSTLEMTRRYVNMFSEDLKEDYEEFSPLDKLKKGTSRTQKIKRGAFQAPSISLSASANLSSISRFLFSRALRRISAQFFTLSVGV